MRSRAMISALLVVVALAPRPWATGEAVHYRITFPEPEHHALRVEATFPAPEDRPLELRMSRSSPGRYALHDFAKNVYGMRAFDAQGRELTLERADPHGWRVAGPGGTVRVVYNVFGDRLDGTYLAVDTTHAHINMPAVILWARGLAERPSTIVFEPPRDANWAVATQLLPGAGPFAFTAPNLQYLMDSPVEFGPLTIRTFTVNGRTIRFAAHHTGTSDELDHFVKDVKKIVREHGRIFGELPDFEPRHYTFLADYLPYAQWDGMEHRNSTVLTSSGTIASNRTQLLETVSHEFFHAWNVERIRPRSLEPFDLDTANMSGELWLAEGFTQYYGHLVLHRAGLTDLPTTLSALGELAASVMLRTSREVRSPEEVSRMASFTDGGSPIDRTHWSSAVSYYQVGGALALALDLSLRGRSAGEITLDDYMRAMWRTHGRPGGSRPGVVDRPYTMADAEARLAEVASDAAFARDFFARFIQGHEIADYERLLRSAGLVLRKGRPAEPWVGAVALATGGRGVRLEGAPEAGTPLYDAGLDRDDEILEAGGSRTETPDRFQEILRRQQSGSTLELVVAGRSGASRTLRLRIGENPILELVTVESTGGAPTRSETALRRSWLAGRDQ